MNDDALVAAARAGDQDAFAQLINPYRAELMAHCYKMLGSQHDAEDALQDALLRAWRGLKQFAGRSGVRSWLYAITTNACLRAIERRPKRVLPIDYGPPADPHSALSEPLVESAWVEPYADELLTGSNEPSAPDARYERRETIELAFIAALQHLPPRQRAVLILRDVLGFSGAEVADALETSTDAVYSTLQRAHETVDARLPEQSQQATLRALGDAGLREIVEVFVDAWERSDVEALAAKLTEDALFAMPPRPEWYRGRDAIAAFLSAIPLSGRARWRVIPTRANGQLAFAQYMWVEDAEAFLPHAIAVVGLDGDRIGEIMIFLGPPEFRPFGVPERIAAPSAQ